MSNQEDQDMEVEALQSIYPEEFEIVEEDPKKLLFSFQTDNYENDDDGASIQVSFKFTPNYPEELPEILIEESENLTDEEEFLEFLKNIGEENIGMPMIYTIVSALVEKLNKENDDRKTAQEKERERTRALEEEEEMKRFEGTKVTVETFLKWKKDFDREQEEIKMQTQAAVSKKPTGKQLFETNESLFKDVADETEVAVDETLFQDLDDLDLDDDDEDDEWHPDAETDEE